jgi:NifU-like protein
MAKKDLLGGSLWEQYSHKVADRMNDPLHRGEITESEAKALGAKLIVADWGAESCGDAVRLYWAVEEKTGKILQARFKSFGCGTAIASSDMMAELCVGKTVDEVLKITNIDVEHAMRDTPDEPAIPPQKMHCSVMAYDVIKQAASVYKGVDKASFEEDDIVCECARVKLSTIQDVIRINDLKTVEEITQYTKAGAFCKSCVRPGGHEKKKYYLVDILRETRAKMELDKSEPGKLTFAKMTVIQKHKFIENVLDAKVRPSLTRDGGSVEVIDITVEGEAVVVKIRYGGACSGCASADTGTLSFIEEVLRVEVDPSIQVARG